MRLAVVDTALARLAKPPSDIRPWYQGLHLLLGRQLVTISRPRAMPWLRATCLLALLCALGPRAVASQGLSEDDATGSCRGAPFSQTLINTLSIELLNRANCRNATDLSLRWNSNTAAEADGARLVPPPPFPSPTPTHLLSTTPKADVSRCLLYLSVSLVVYARPQFPRSPPFPYILAPSPCLAFPIDRLSPLPSVLSPLRAPATGGASC